MMPRIEVAISRTSAPPIGSTIPLKAPIPKAFRRELPSARSGMEITAPSGTFWRAIPSDRASAAAILKSVVNAPAIATPTAIPSGKLWIVTASASLAVRDKRLFGPSASPLTWICGVI